MDIIVLAMLVTAATLLVKSIFVYEMALSQASGTEKNTMEKTEELSVASAYYASYRYLA